jgi:hypothetical protein
MQKEIKMSIELSEQNLEAVAKGEPFRFIAPKTNIEFVVVRADVYDRVKELFGDNEVDPEAMYPLLAEIAPEDWDDPSVYGISTKP